MKSIEFKNNTQQLKIKFERIKPFKNICAVTGAEEFCNLVVEYTPSNKIIDIVSYREYFNKTFNELIENIAIKVFNDINDEINPLYLKVTVFLEGNPHLTDWSCTIEK